MVRKKITRFWFTVVGFYVDNGQKFCDHVLASNPQEAEKSMRARPEIDEGLIVVGVFRGKKKAIDKGEFIKYPLSFIR